MLQLKNIVKDYGSKDNIVHALKGININFRKSEFVSILGQSGCGKTTLLNIIGGLDRYTEGDLLIDGISTKNYKDVDWDTYRNVRIGFIFQSYNLITHIDVLSNVELALTLSGVGPAERKRRALEALEAVGLKDQAKKRPNQLSGGQMQRVSIARALINNPDIILADEPTGALDSNTSTQIMDILKDIAKDRLVIMVTHNPELADAYSTRIIKLQDGEMINDSNPFEIIDESVEEIYSKNSEIKIETINKKQERRRIKDKKKALKSTSMSFLTAIKLSFNNLMTKKGRTILTSLAASIGIIGVALVLAISNGFSAYIASMQTDMLAGYPIQIAENSIDMATLISMTNNGDTQELDSSLLYSDSQNVSFYKPKALEQLIGVLNKNNLSDEYLTYLNNMDKSLYSSIYYSYPMEINILTKAYMSTMRKNILYYSGNDINSNYQNINNFSMIMGITELTGDETFIESQYDKLYGNFPKEKDEIMLVVDEANRLNMVVAAALGIDFETDAEISFEEIINRVNTSNLLRAYANNEYYKKVTDTYYEENNYEEIYTSDVEYVSLKIVGIYRPKKNVSYTTLTSGICYSNLLTEYLLEKNMTSDIVIAQRNYNKNIRDKDGKFQASGGMNVMSQYMGATVISDKDSSLAALGGSKKPSAINIYPIDFNCKEKIVEYLDAWNNSHKKEEKVQYNDMAALLVGMLNQMIKIITIALVCFSAVSLFVSSFMIAIITYVSVVERTKEIGILRSLGARKIDISRVFNAETGIIGFAAGLFGVIITYLISIPINLIVNIKAGMALNICSLNPLTALAMIALSIVLNLIAGIIPASIAAKRDPVIALRTE